MSSARIDSPSETSWISVLFWQVLAKKWGIIFEYFIIPDIIVPFAVIRHKITLKRSLIDGFGWLISPKLV
jgi:hypothetical protein